MVSQSGPSSIGRSMMVTSKLTFITNVEFYTTTWSSSTLVPRPIELSRAEHHMHARTRSEPDPTDDETARHVTCVRLYSRSATLNLGCFHGISVITWHSDACISDASLRLSCGFTLYWQSIQVMGGPHSLCFADRVRSLYRGRALVHMYTSLLPVAPAASSR